MDKQEANIHLKLGDIIQLASTTTTTINDRIYIIIYIDDETIVLNTPNETEPLVLTMDEAGIFSNINIDEITLLNRSDKEGYLAQNNLIVGNIIELVFIEESGNVQRIYGRLTTIEEDMMALTLHPSKEIIYIDFGYKGIPLELNLRSINVIEAFPVEAEKNVVEPTNSLNATPDEPSYELPLPQDQPIEEAQDRVKQLFISADNLFLGADLGEIQQDVQLGEKERRYGIDTQLNDLLDELLSVVPNEERNERVLSNINNMIDKFKQLRTKHSTFDESNNANKKPEDIWVNTPLVKNMQQFKHSLNWIIPVIKAKKQLFNLNLEEELIKDINSSTNQSVLSELNNFIDNYYKGDTTSQYKYEQYMRFMNSFFKPISEVVSSENAIINEVSVSKNINVILDNLDDFYSEVAVGISKDQVALSKQRFVSTVLTGNESRTQLVKGKMGDLTVNTIPVVNGNIMQLKSFMVIPESIVSQNKAGSLNTLIIDKTTSNTNTDYYNYLRKTTSVVNHYVGNADDDNLTLKSSITRLITGPVNKQNNIYHIEPSQAFMEAFTDLPENDQREVYLEFLSQFIPSNKDILRELNMSKTSYLKDITSLDRLFVELEAFLIDRDNFTRGDMVEAQKIIDANINRIKKKLINRGDELNMLITKEVGKTTVLTGMTKNAIRLLLASVPIVEDGENDPTTASSSDLTVINIIRNALETYYTLSLNVSPSESLKRINDYDYGHFLNLCLSYLSIGLHSNVNLNSELTSIDQLITAEMENNQGSSECQTVTVVKKYHTIEDLNADNGSIIYVDAEYDSTRYDIIDIYNQQQKTMTPPQFKEFLKDKLMENIGLNEQTAQKEADAMISGKRLVEETDVALLEITGDKPRYYSRVNNQWKRDTTIKYDVQTGNLVCATKKECYSVKNKCVDEDVARQLVEATDLQAMVNIFDIQREKNNAQLKKNIGSTIRSLFNNKSNSDRYKEAIRQKDGITRKRIATEAVFDKQSDGSKLKSPYSKLFQAIMGQEDFVQKQHNIVKFVNQFTYDVSDNYWYLCIKTSQKLIPKFIFQLAKAFLGTDDYFLVREQICANQGVLSDDGDKWVDKHSGYVIKTVDASGEEGYDGDGYKLQSREALENNMDAILKQRQQDLQTEDTKKEGLAFTDADFTAPYANSVIKIINALGRSMQLELHTHKPFIVNTVLRFNDANFSTKENYDKKALLIKKQKNITLPSFDIAINLNLLLLTCCCVILSIQLAKPRLNTSKNVAGCFKYFKGFPFDANGDQGALVYIACVVSKIKNPKTMPWKAIGKTRVEGFVKKMMAKFDRQILKDRQIVDSIEEKHEWVKLHPDEEDALVSNVDRNATLELWTTFKPSLDISYATTSVNSLSDEFKREMLGELKKGSRKFNDNMNVIMGKIIEQAIFYKNSVHGVVRDSDMLLKNAYQEPYMQNCFGSTPLREKGVIKYLNSKNNMLTNIVDTIRINEKIVADLRAIIKSPTMNPFFNTRKTIIDSTLDFNEGTIYKYFIKQCEFGTDIPITPALTRLCGSKPHDFDVSKPLKEQLAHLKSNGYQFSNTSLQELLKYVGQSTTVSKDLFNELYGSTHYLFKDFLLQISEMSHQSPLNEHLFDATVVSGLTKLFSSSLLTPSGFVDESTYNRFNKDSGIMRELKNQLSLVKDTTKITIKEFIQTPSSTSRKQKKQLESFTTLMETIATTQRKHSSLKQLMHLTCIVFPNMVINNADFSNITLPKHWGLSDLHSRDVKTFLLNFYQGFKQFYSEATEAGDEGLDGIDESLNSINLFKRALLLARKPLRTLYLMIDNLPLSSEKNNSNGFFILDARFYDLFFDYMFVKVIDIIIKCVNLINNRSAVLLNYEKSRIGLTKQGDITDSRKFDPITEDELSEFVNRQMSDEDMVYNDDAGVIGILNDYFIHTFGLVSKYYDTSMVNYDTIYKKILSSRENEKNTITRTLKDMTDEEREIQNLFKGHKLESWGKGLTKGLTRYVKENYDEERVAMEKRLNYEKTMGVVDNATRMNMEIFMEAATYEELMDAEIDAEVYDTAHLGNDDDHGDMDGDEFY